MKHTNLVLHNRDIEIVCRERSENKDYEIWLLAEVKGKRTVLDHFLGYSDLSETLNYLVKGDLDWEETTEPVPEEKSKYAASQEKDVENNKYRNRSGYFDALWYSPVDRKSWNAAKKIIKGTWSDGELTLSIKAEDEVSIVPPVSKDHPFHSMVFIESPYWWDLKKWTLSLGGPKGGSRYPVWNCFENELHLVLGKNQIMAYSLKRME